MVRTSTADGAADNDGLIQRFQLAVWPDLSKNYTHVDEFPDKSARDAAFDVFDRLHDIDLGTIAAQRNEEDGPCYIGFGPTAKELFDDWFVGHQNRIRSGDLPSVMEAHLSKYASLVPSIALICHLADNDNGAISEASMIKALGWAKYLESHANRIYSPATAPETTGASRIIKEITRKSIGSTFTAREIQRKHWTELPNKDRR